MASGQQPPAAAVLGQAQASAPSSSRLQTLEWKHTMIMHAIGDSGGHQRLKELQLVESMKRDASITGILAKGAMGSSRLRPSRSSPGPETSPRRPSHHLDCQAWPPFLPDS
ncbi:unnamed protein product [Miscanthus lutarioriparius]|uniref:Uncharacterized protein n=1 Tax=Miscanthus lutarioriparius TaxID=422564 RepID=A0A811R5X0_9POAL|nr:unnamed protein product [Miscanthus lutarioriparius]